MKCVHIIKCAKVRALFAENKVRFARAGQLCDRHSASSDIQIKVSATGVLQLLDHACGTRCQSIYGSATASDSLNGYWSKTGRPICLVFGTAALCDALVRSAV